MSEKKYTAEDFAKAQAATLNRTRGLGGRVDHGDSLPWLILSEDDRRWVRDEDMAAGGWVPVPSSPAKPTITESKFEEEFGLFSRTDKRLMMGRLDRLGITVVPDPEPTNAERLTRGLACALDGLDWQTGDLDFISNLTEALDAAGVTAPGGEE